MKSEQPTWSAVSTSSDQQHVCICMHVHLATIPHNTLLESDVMIKGYSQSCYVLRMNTLTEEVWWSEHRTAVSMCAVLDDQWVSGIAKHAPHIWGTGSGIFPPFQLLQVSMTFISIITAILYKIVISSSQQDSFSLQIKAIAGEWWIPLCMLWLLTPEGKITGRALEGL